MRPGDWYEFVLLICVLSLLASLGVLALVVKLYSEVLKVLALTRKQ